MRAANLDTPVAFFIYRRPDLTQRVWATIAGVRPSRLFVVADGPKQGERELCDETRRVTERIDWPCAVKRHYADHNLGCAARMSTGISWVFDEVEEAILLEDDCVPDPSFFRFCAELLARYRDDTRVAMISGDNFQGRRGPHRHSYYFSVFSHIWGWATWRRSWRQFDLEMAGWPAFRDSRRLAALFGRPRDVEYWTRVMESAHRREIDTWDYAWMFSCWQQNALTILPAANLVSNIGFDGRATHTRRRNAMLERQFGSVPFPLHHPQVVERDAAADERTQDLFASLGQNRSLLGRLGSLARGLGLRRG